MCEKDFGEDFDLLEDPELLDMLRTGILNDVPTYSTPEVTATQVLNINKQELIPRASSRKHDINSPTDHTFGIIEADHLSCGVNAVDRKPLSIIIDNYQAAAVVILPKGAPRFGDPVSGQQIREKNVGAVPKKTRTVNAWSVKVWAEWARHRNSQPVTVMEPGFPIPEDIGLLDDITLNYWGQHFIMEIKRQDGADYPPNTLQQIVCGLQWYLRNDCGKTYVNFIKECTHFDNFRKSLDTRMKELYAAGVGSKISSSDPVTMDDKIQLWESGVFNSNTATGLSNAIFCYNGKLFGLRGFTEHVNCQASQFEI